MNIRLQQQQQRSGKKKEKRRQIEKEKKKKEYATQQIYFNTLNITQAAEEKTLSHTTHHTCPNVPHVRWNMSESMMKKMK